MKKLLAHLEAHCLTRDPWILVYDNVGTFPEGIGDCVVLNSFDSVEGRFFGFPVIRECEGLDRRSQRPIYTVRLSRQFLSPLIERLRQMAA